MKLKSNIHDKVLIVHDSLQEPLSQNYLFESLEEKDVDDKDAKIILASFRAAMFGEPPSEKEQLQSKYKQLTGDHADARWSVERLRKEIQEADAAILERDSRDLLEEVEEKAKGKK